MFVQPLVGSGQSGRFFERILSMITSGSITLAGAATPGVAVLGPFPDGSILRGLRVSSQGGSTSVQVLGVAIHQQQVGATTAEASTGRMLFTGSALIGTAPLVVRGLTLADFGMTPLSRLDMNFFFYEILSASGLGVFVSITFDDSIQASVLCFSLDIDLPILKLQAANNAVAIVSPPKTGGVKGSKLPVSKGSPVLGVPHVSSRKPNDAHTPFEYPGSQSTPEWNPG